MSKTITCDRCGRIITGEPYVHRIDHKLARRKAPTIEEQAICQRRDLCRTCATKVSAYAGGDE